MQSHADYLIEFLFENYTISHGIEINILYFQYYIFISYILCHKKENVLVYIT